MWKLYVVFPNSHPHSQYMKIPFFLHPCQHLSFVFFDDGPSDSCEMISHCGSDLHLLDDCTTFHGCLHFLKFWKTGQFLCPFYNQVVSFLMVSCVDCLYILDINPLLVILFANNFSHSVVWFCFVVILSEISQTEKDKY